LIWLKRRRRKSIINVVNSKERDPRDGEPKSTIGSRCRSRLIAGFRLGGPAIGAEADTVDPSPGGDRIAGLVRAHPPPSAPCGRARQVACRAKGGAELLGRMCGGPRRDDDGSGLLQTPHELPTSASSG